jgi:hypothetical protein
MNLKIMLLINAVVAAVFGLALVIVPGEVIAIYGITADAGLRYMGQLFGLCLVGHVVLCWFAKDAPESEARTAIVRALFVTNGLGLVVSLVAQLKGVTNAVGWSTVAIYLLLALGWAYFLRAKPAA